jgi:hypothetical protein
MAAVAEQEKKLLSSVVDDIRSYTGSDPLHPWLWYGTTACRSLPSLSRHSISCDFVPVFCAPVTDRPMTPMISTSRRTSSTPTGVRSFFLEMDLQASASPKARSVQRYVTPNSPRPSSAPSSYRSAMSRPVGSRSTTSLSALAGAEPLYSIEKGFGFLPFFCFGSLGFLPPPASVAPFGVPQQLPIPSRCGDPAAPDKANQ